MKNYQKLIFVSMGGTCRSILAKAIFDNMSAQDEGNMGSEINTESRGLVVLFNEPVNPKAAAIAKSKGIDISIEKSEPLEPEDFGDGILVLVMTDLLKKQVYEKFEHAVNVYSIREFTGEALDVESAFGGALVDYGLGYEYLEKLVAKVRTILLQDDAQ